MMLITKLLVLEYAGIIEDGHAIQLRLTLYTTSGMEIPQGHFSIGCLQGK